MKGKLLFVVGLGVGYVLGTRAGRQRYEQIASAAKNVWNAPTVQQGVGAVKDFAMARVGDVSDTVLDGVKHFVRNATTTQHDAKQGVKRAAKTAKAAVDDLAEELDDAIDEGAAAAKAAAAKVSETAKTAKQSASGSKPAAKRTTAAKKPAPRKSAQSD